MIVPENIFDLLPEIEDIRNYKGLGAIFSPKEYLDRFSISITFEISSEAYYSDEVLEINNTEIDINNMDLSNYGFDGTIADIVNINAFENINSTVIEEANSEIKNSLDTITSPDLLNGDVPDCPEPTQEELDEFNTENSTTVYIKNEDDEIIQEVSMNLLDNSKTCDNSNVSEQLKSTFLNSLPKINPGNNIKPSTSPLCILPENSELSIKTKKELQKLNITTDSIEDYNNKLLTEGIDKTVSEAINNSKIIGESNTPEEQQQLVNETIAKELPKYGIPLLEINTDENIIINIVDGELQVLNFSKEFKIDIENIKILPEIIYTMVYIKNFNSHTIILKKYFEDDKFSNTKLTTDKTGLFYLGMDKSGLKQFCGKIYDIQLKKENIDIIDITSGTTYFPELYGTLAYYDFYNKSEIDSRIIYNKVYPYQSISKPLSLRGKDWYLETRKNGNYTFPNHSIIDDLFCKNKFTTKDFSIILFFKRNAYLTEINPEYFISNQVIFSDIINSNSVWYDEKNMELHIEFHGYSDKIFINFVPGTWYQLSIRYDYINQRFFTDVIYEDSKLISSNISLDTPGEQNTKAFQLNSIYGEYSFNERMYKNKFDTLSGPLVLFDKLVTSEYLKQLYVSFYPVLNYYKDVGGIYSEKGIIYDNY